MQKPICHPFFLSVLIFFLSVSSLAFEADDVVLKSTPISFSANYQIINGTITSRLALQSNLGFQVQNSEGQTRAYQLKDDSTAWSVSSQSCPQNKSFTCVSSYQKDDTAFTLFRLNPNQSSQSVVIQCNGQFKENFWRDQAWLKSCLHFSQQSCASWSNFVKTVESFYTKPSRDETKQESFAELARNMAQQAKSINQKVSELFQSEISTVKKDLATTVEQAISGKYLPVIPTKVNIETDQLNTIATAYREIFKINKGCSEYQKIFHRNEELSHNSKPLKDSSPPSSSSSPSHRGAGSNRQ